ncbi:E3 ubiquitin-protein ligase SMURF2 isoform X2 [Hydra vulgaris]|uniref:E3 ubiquitin-protein ligase n=1 Tax=Hydra vulgaris TaxID=6087 RepID=A0ABM4CCE6_HYDVU
MTTPDRRRIIPVKYRVTILCANNIAKRDFFRLPDPFARISVDGSGQCHTTCCLKKTVDPKWNQYYDLFVAHTESITISVWNQRKVHKCRGAGFLGAVKVLPTAIERLKDKGYHSLNLTNVNSDDNQYVTGQITVSIASKEYNKGRSAVVDLVGNVLLVPNDDVLVTNHISGHSVTVQTNLSLPNSAVPNISIQNERSGNACSDAFANDNNLVNDLNGATSLPVYIFKKLHRQSTERSIPLPAVEENSMVSFPLNKFSTQSNKAGLSCIHSGNNQADRHRLYLNRTLLHKDSTENFERRTTPQGQVYFVNRVTGQSTWHDPTLLKQPISNDENINKLPEGWEVRYTANGRQYFVDHNTKTTQFAHPCSNSSSSSNAQSNKTITEKNEELPQYRRDLLQKIKAFRAEIHLLQLDAGHFRIEVSRDDVFEQSYQSIMKTKARELRKRLVVKFKNEVGLDFGGIAREWLYILSQEMFNPYYGLFKYSKDSQYTLEVNPDSGVNPDHLSYFHFVGRIVGIAVFHHHYLDGGFTMPFYKQLLGKPNTLEDLESVDPELYRSLKWVAENKINDVIFQTFAVEHLSFGKTTLYDLKKDGSQIPVTDDNKKEFLKLYVNYRLRHGVEMQFKAFMKGFNELVPQHIIRMFDERELELLICGLGKIDIADWKANTCLKHCSKDHNIVQWFWEIVDFYDEEKRARLLQFVTGSSRVPVQGFKALQGSTGSNGPRLFTISLINADIASLPKSHTCFNRIDLPKYESKSQLYEKLTLAIEETCGFNIE